MNTITITPETRGQLQHRLECFLKAALRVSQLEAERANFSTEIEATGKRQETGLKALVARTAIVKSRQALRILDSELSQTNQQADREWSDLCDTIEGASAHMDKDQLEDTFADEAKTLALARKLIADETF